MKTNLLSIVVFLVGALTATTALAQSPNLGTASSYALFTAVGAFTNTGPSVITGDIGTNAGAFTGFPPGTVNGQVHVADPASTTAATDVATAYGYLSALTCGIVLGTGLGNGQTLTPNVYCTGAASTLNGDLILDAQGDPGALFIFKIDGALSTGSSSNVLLINGASLCNVYWQINGQFDLGTSAVFRGIIVANGAINLYTSSTLLGKGLTQAGAINLQSNVVTISTEPVVASITGTTTVCVGKTTSLSNTTIGGVWTSSDTLLATINNIGLVTGVLQGVPTIHYTVTNSIGCITRVSTPVIVNKNTSLATITGASGICIGSTTSLLGTPAGGTWTSNNNTVATITNLGLVSGLSAGATQFVFTNTATTCSATSLAVTINAGTASSTTIANCGSYLWNGVSYPATGTYTKTFTGGSSAGCDSIATLHLTINAATSSSTTIANCGSYLWNGVSYPATGTYTKTFTGGSSAGCDSIATLHLTVNAATASSTTIANCGSYLWNGVSYTATGIYTKPFIGGSSAGCDSIATLHLTVNAATTSSTNIANCGSYLWNGVSYPATGTYTKTFTSGSSAGCDSIATLHLTINAATSSSTTIANCGSYFWNGVSYPATGTYTKTFTGGSSAGCDSIATLHLTVNAATSSSTTIANCGSYLWNGISYPATGTYTKTFTGGSSAGCDSIATLHLTVNAATASSTTIANCGSYLWNGVSYSATGTYTKTFTGGSSAGCDSITTLHLTVNAATASSTTIANCGSYLWNGVSYPATGTYTKAFTGGSSAGCDSIATLHLTVNAATASSTTIANCGSYFWNGVSYPATGTYTKTFTGGSSKGCDSIATLHLTVNAATSSSTTIANCGSYLWNGVSYPATGTYTKTFTGGSSAGCDSIATLHLTVNAATVSSTTIANCGSYLWNGVSYPATGTYTKTLTGGSSKGCDSIATLHLTVNTATTSSTTIANCGSYLWNGVSYPATGTYTKTFTGGSSAGCDSIATLHLTVNAATSSSTTIANCGSYFWNGVSYPATGTYTKTFTGGSSAGCDSIATLHLTVNAGTSSSTTIANCGSYLWNGVNYPATGTYTKTFTGGNGNGCDSIATLHLTVNAATASSTTIANCDSYLWNGVIYPATGTYTKTFTGGSSAGCDSIATLHLTVNAATSSLTTISNCGSYLWNGVSYPATGSYTKTFTGGSSVGCDSIATLHLTVNAATSSLTTIANCGSYLWNGVSYPATGTYTKTFIGGSSAGCDSIATLHLTVNAATTSTTTIANCGSYLWNGVSYPATGTYTKTFTGGSSAGCDSIATLHLTINSATSSSTNIASCGNYLWNGVSYATAGTYIKTFTGGNKVGCDSIATLHLTINHATYSTTTVVTCGCLSYTWNGINYTANGIYIDTLIGANSVGCDSIATINLTLNLLPKTPVILNSTIIISGARNGVIYSVTPVAGAVSYQWVYSGTGATIYNNGTAAITVDFAANATGGDILVQSVSATGCLSIAQVVTVTITPLPVVLSSFNGLKFNKDVLLKWTSVSEINIAEFNIQRSYNGNDFDKVGAMIAKGSGNYSFIDNSIINTGIIYYQLEVVGNDGSKEYSKVLAINMDTKSTDISIYPNPAKGIVMILSPYATGRLAICNLMGETMLSQQIIDKQIKVDIGSLLPGVYIVNVLTAEGEITSKLIVQ